MDDYLRPRLAVSKRLGFAPYPRQIFELSDSGKGRELD